MKNPIRIPSRAIIAVAICLASGFRCLHAEAQSIDQAAQQIESKVIEWRRDFHQHPELSNREFETSKKVADHLRKLGIEVTTGIAHTGVKGVLKGGHPGPVVALRADMDALPVTERVELPFASKVLTDYNGAQTGVMHACGHDAHTAILMGVAEILAGMQKDLHGTVVFIFQPAEEGAPKGEDGGAELMVKEAVLENPKVDAIFGLHMKAEGEAGKLFYRSGPIMAGVSDFKIEVNGKSSHGSAPWTSVDPIVLSAEIINNLQTIVSRNIKLTANPAVVTVGAIHGGNRSNIIPEEVDMVGTVRTFSESDEQLIIQRIHSISEHLAEAAGGKAVVSMPYSVHYPVTDNNRALTAQMLPSLQHAAGAENVIEVEATTGAEDFSFFQQQVPGLYFFLGGLPAGKDPKSAAPHHTPDFYLDESGFVVGVKAFLHLVLDYEKMNPVKAAR